MSIADFRARIKKIEIVNKVLADGWAQAIRVQLDDIELTNENLLELRQFRPNESVDVVIKSVQPNLFEFAARNPNKVQTGTAPNREPALDDTTDDEEFLSFTEEDEDKPLHGKVAREFKV